MKGFRSITAKYILLGIVILSLIVSFTALSFWFTNHIKNDGRKINLAGRQRMLNFEMAWLLSKSTKETGEEKTKTINYLKEEMALFEEVLYGLRDGSERHKLHPLASWISRREINSLIEKWYSEIKPTLIKAVEGDPEAFREYNLIIHGYINGIDSFVHTLEDNYKGEFRLYGRLRLGVITIAVFVFIALAFFVRKSLVIPMLEIRNVSEEAGKGNLDVRVDIKSKDEIGVLGHAFNRMIEGYKRDKEELRRLYQKYEGLINTIDSIVWEADAKTFQFTFVSKQAEQLLGYPVEQWLTEPTFWKDHIHPDDREWTVEFCVKATAEKRPHRFDYRIIAADGHIVWVRSIVTVVVEDDQPVRLRGIMVDITEVKAAEEQILKLSLAIEQSPSTVVITDNQGNIEYVNPRFTEITGYTVEEVIGKNPRILSSGKTPHGVYKELWETITSGKEWRGEWQNKKKNGDLYWAQVTIFPIKDSKGKIAHFLGEEVDITEKKQAEERLREYSERLEEQFRLVAMAKQEWQDTFDNITDMIFIHDRDFIVLRANRALAEYFGLSSTGMIGKNCHELFFGKDSPVLSCPSDIAMDEGQEVTTEVFIPRTSRIFRMSSFPFYISERDVQSFICIARDITDEKEREMRLAMSERLATLGHVASGIAHEINNPLASIAGCAEGLLTKVKKGQYDPVLCEKYLNVIEEEILRCKNITTSMLSFARKTTYEKKEININNLLDKTLEIIGFQGRIKDTEVKKNYKEELPSIYGSEGELRQVFLSIITNALDAMEDKGTITIETGTENDNTVFIKISDTGHGIPSENRDRIFDSFFTTKSDKGGTGLGLAIAHKIITNHNGNIEVISESGKGTTFKIILPVSQS